MNDQPPSSSTWWRCTASVFRWLLRLYPRPFREAYSVQMLQDFRDLWEEAALRSGALGISHLCWNTLGDLVVTAIAERLRKEPVVERGLVVRLGAALIWATAMFYTLDALITHIDLPVRIRMELAELDPWLTLSFEVAFLAGLVGLQLKYRQCIPWYLWLIGIVTALAYCYERPLPILLSLGENRMPGDAVLTSLYYNNSPGSWSYGIILASNLVYAVGMLIWALSMLLKGMLPRWTAVLLLLYALDGLLQVRVPPGTASHGGNRTSVQPFKLSCLSSVPGDAVGSDTWSPAGECRVRLVGAHQIGERAARAKRGKSSTTAICRRCGPSGVRSSMPATRLWRTSGVVNATGAWWTSVVDG